MAIGERIHYFRILRGFTQKYLGKMLGFSDSQADVRIAQYEKGTRSPKEKYLNALAQILEVSPHALDVPDIDSNIGLMHTLFTLEDTRGLKIGEIDGELCLRLDKSTGMDYVELYDMLYQWFQQEQSSNPARLQKISMINGVIPIPKWKSNELAGNGQRCAKNEKLNKICNKNTNKKGLAKLISLNSVRPFLLVSVGFYLITSGEI